MPSDPRHLLSGPPPALPAVVDRLAERWARTPPRVRWLAVTLVAVALLAAVGRGAARSPWGDPVPVVVATGDLPAGHVLTSDDLRVARWPETVVPDGARHRPDPLVGRGLATGVTAAAPVTDRHVAAGGAAAGLAPGEVAYPLALPDGVTLIAGQRIDVLAGDRDGSGVRLAGGARVLSVQAGTAWLAVGRDEAPGLAAASQWGGVTVALLPAPDA